MKMKKILVDSSEKNIVATAMANSENEKLDILKFVLGGILKSGSSSAMCNEAPDYRAYADSTYVKH